MALCGDGLSVDAELVRAAEQATEQALDAIEGGTPDLVTVFVCSADPDEAAAALERAGRVTGARTVVGCSAAGVIGGGRGVETTSSVSVWVAQLPGAALRSFHLEVLRTSESIAVVGMPVQRPDDAAAMLLVDPYSFPVDAFVEQANDELPGLMLSGGLATGLRGAGSTRLLVDGVVHDRGAVGVVLGGSVSSTAIVSQGCRPVGRAMTVTAAEGNVLLGLAGVPAIDKLEQLVATLSAEEQALATRGLQLGIAMDEYADEHTRGDFLVRGVVGADPQRRGLVVGDVVEVGRTVQFQVRDADTADVDLRTVLRTTYDRDDRADHRIAGALLFSCTGRGAGLFASADHDVLAVRDGLHTSGVAGFFAAGEIGPVGGRNHLHGFTASVLAFATA
ncbi:MAG: FIST signal transduction protein [Actinomycetes bacterium]